MDANTVFQNEARNINENYSKLRFESTNSGLPIVCGELDLFDEEENLVDTYSIRIEPTDLYPLRFPFLFETGNRIPKNIDWHVYETDGHCCICTVPEELIKCKKGIDLAHFIENEVKPYLFNQTHRRLRGFFIQERLHGDAGEFQYYYSIFRTTDLLEIAKLLYFISKKQEPTRVDKCFCGRNEKYRHCHREAYKAFVLLESWEIMVLVNRIVKSKQFLVTHPTFGL